MGANPYEDLHAAAQQAQSMLGRVAGDGGILEQIAVGEWDGNLTEPQARDLTDILEVMYEHVRGSRATAGGQAFPDGPHPYAGSGFREMLATALPLNRKERYYTGTVLPMIVASNQFMHLPRFLRLCGLHVEHELDHGTDGMQKLQFFTEYNFAESRFTVADRNRFLDAPTGGDTPDILLVGPDWMLAVEAKMFHNPTAEALNRQMRRQLVIIDYLTRTLRIPADRVAHVLLLPRKLRSRAVNAPVVTWEDVLGEYRVVGPAYWVAVLAEALVRYDDLVAHDHEFGKNADDHMTGAQIVKAHGVGALEFTYMGRNGGLEGGALTNDLATGGWRTQLYEVRWKPLDRMNWFPVSEFIARTAVG